MDIYKHTVFAWLEHICESLLYSIFSSFLQVRKYIKHFILCGVSRVVTSSYHKSTPLYSIVVFDDSLCICQCIRYSFPPFKHVSMIIGIGPWVAACIRSHNRKRKLLDINWLYRISNRPTVIWWIMGTTGLNLCGMSQPTHSFDCCHRANGWRILQMKLVSGTFIARLR